MDASNDPTPAPPENLKAVRDLGMEMCSALGLDPSDILGFTLEVRADCLPNLTVIHYAWKADVEAFTRTLTRFDLVPK
jgi:hypothetical protein